MRKKRRAVEAADDVPDFAEAEAIVNKGASFEHARLRVDPSYFE